jgi:hypothetical protein
MRGVVITLVAVGWLAPRGASACSCERSKPGPGIATAADVVFEGTVRRRWLDPYDRPAGGFDGSFSDGERNVVFAVRRVWRGELGPRVTIKTPRRISECGARFVVGASYVVFADRERDGALWAISCGHTARVRDADEMLGLLGDADVPRSGGGCRVAGDAGGWLGLLALLVRRRRGRVELAADRSVDSRGRGERSCSFA